MLLTVRYSQFVTHLADKLRLKSAELRCHALVENDRALVVYMLDHLKDRRARAHTHSRAHTHNRTKAYTHVENDRALVR